MFRDITASMNNPVLQQLLSFCLFDNTPQGMENALNRYPGKMFYGWIENNEPLGICGFRELQDKVEVCHIAASPTSRRKGIGKNTVTALCKKYSKTIEAETDDDAVGFYRKCGFETIELYKEYGNKKYRRWQCILDK